MAAPHGVEVTGPMGERLRRGPHARRPWSSSPSCTGPSTAGGWSCSQAREDRVRGARRRRHAGLPRRDRRTIREGDSGRSPPPAPGPGRPPGRDHRPDRPQDDHQRAQLRRQGVAGRLRGRQHPALGERRRRPAQPAGRDRPARSTSPARGQGVRARRRRAGHDRRPPARLAPAGEAHHRRRRADFGQPGRLRALLLPLRAAAARRGPGARTSTCRRWRATSRRGCGTTCSSSPRTRSGIPRGTIRATVLIETYPAAFEMEEILYELREHSAGPERRPLGLHLQRHQEVPHPRARSSCCRTATRSP